MIGNASLYESLHDREAPSPVKKVSFASLSSAKSLLPDSGKKSLPRFQI